MEPRGAGASSSKMGTYNKMQDSKSSSLSSSQEGKPSHKAAKSAKAASRPPAPQKDVISDV